MLKTKNNMEQDIINELDRLEQIFRATKPGSDEEYYYSKAIDAMAWISDEIGRKMFDNEVIETLKIISESINNVIKNNK